MRTGVWVTLMLCLSVLKGGPSFAENVVGVESIEPSRSCVRIQSGDITDSTGAALTVGYDEWGYNFQARQFNGTYCDAYQNADWCQAWTAVELIMSWNNAWLSRTDCDNDGFLDRHFGFDSYRGSGAWLTNHVRGSYEGESGSVCNWTGFTKIIAAPIDAFLADSVWYDAEGVEIGPATWGDFAIVQDVYNDPCSRAIGLQLLSPTSAGLGYYGP